MLPLLRLFSDSLRLTPIANQYWAPGALQRAPFDASVVDSIFDEDIMSETLSVDERGHNLALLELSGYLENFLWPNWAPETSGRKHTLSLLALVNEKFRQTTIGVWCRLPDGVSLNVEIVLCAGCSLNLVSPDHLRSRLPLRRCQVRPALRRGHSHCTRRQA